MRRTRALLEARAELPSLLHIIDGAVFAERELRQRIELREAELGLFELDMGKVARWLQSMESSMRAARELRESASKGCRAS